MILHNLDMCLYWKSLHDLNKQPHVHVVPQDLHQKGRNLNSLSPMTLGACKENQGLMSRRDVQVRYCIKNTKAIIVVFFSDAFSFYPFSTFALQVDAGGLPIGRDLRKSISPHPLTFLLYAHMKENISTMNSCWCIEWVGRLNTWKFWASWHELNAFRHCAKSMFANTAKTDKHFQPPQHTLKDCFDTFHCLHSACLNMEATFLCS